MGHIEYAVYRVVHYLRGLARARLASAAKEFRTRTLLQQQKRIIKNFKLYFTCNFIYTRFGKLNGSLPTSVWIALL